MMRPKKTNPDLSQASRNGPAASIVEGATTGFRLLRFEVYNWGTFHDKVWRTEPNGGMALLTGANGSGKSTLVDALLTLLVPNLRRGYNQASGVDRRRERDEKSYVQGAYGRQRDEQSSSGRVQYLRDRKVKERTHSVLLAVFHNEALRETVTLAQVFWFQEDELHKMHIVHPTAALSIAEHFVIGGNAAEFKKQLKAQGAEVFDEFSRYSERFRKVFGLRSDKALDLFSQIVSIKEIGGLNEFVREHMLERGNEQEQITGLRDNFENLNQSHEQILRAERQLAALRPMIADANRHAEVLKRVAEAERGAAITPYYFFWRRKDLLEQAKTQAEAEIQEFLLKRKTFHDRREELTADQLDLEVTLRNDATEQRIAQLAEQIAASIKLRNFKRGRADEYSKLAHSVGWRGYEDEAAFNENRQKLPSARKLIDDNMSRIDQSRLSNAQERQKFETEIRELEAQIDILKRHRSRIPSEQLAIREALAQALGVADTDLPFAGELLKVRPEEQMWEGAIERLLNGYARQMLVSEALYRRVSGYVNQHNLRGRLVYLRMSRQAARPTGSLDDAQVAAKLEVKPDSEYYRWLRTDIAQRFDHACCDTLEEFHREPRALTREGQIKTGGERHEKDDRRALDDRRYYVLGWDNRDQLEAFQADLAEKQQALERLHREFQQVERERKKWKERDDVVRALEPITDFSAMHWRAEQVQIERYEAERRDLESQTDSTRLLRERLEQVKTELAGVSADYRLADQEVIRRETQIHNYERQIDSMDRRLESAPSDSEAYRELIEAELRNRPVTLESSEELSESVRDTFVRRQKNYEGQRNTLAEALIRAMSDFRRDYPQATEELDANLAAIPGFRQLLETIEQDDLPRHKERFKRMLDEKILSNITFFDKHLRSREEAIGRSIDNLNQALRRIDYTPATYIHLDHNSTDDKEIREFRAMLRACYANVDSRDVGSIEQSFYRVRDLIQRFEKDDRWTRKVTDVRNWMSFSASERYKADDAEKMFYTDSSGKSGGQKAKLAYTIMASAIAYQYGLGQAEDQVRSFRFVVVDEAFSKSDESNARYAMELFKQLGLQLLVVTPLDKTHVVEPYIGACHFVTNNQDENDSKVYNLTIAQYHEYRETLIAEGRYDHAG